MAARLVAENAVGCLREEVFRRKYFALARIWAGRSAREVRFNMRLSMRFFVAASEGLTTVPNSPVVSVAAISKIPHWSRVCVPIREDLHVEVGVEN